MAVLMAVIVERVLDRQLGHGAMLLGGGVLGNCWGQLFIVWFDGRRLVSQR